MLSSFVPSQPCHYATGGVPRERLDDFGFRAHCEANPGRAEEGLQGRESHHS